MRSIAILSALVACVAASDVIELTQKTFAETVDAESLMLVEFFAPWCGYCKALAPEYETAATELKKLSVKLAKVDCTAEGDLCQEQGVSGYPTLKVFSHGKSSEYGGARNAEGIVGFMKKRSLPAVSIVTAENHTDFTKADKVVVIAYLKADDTANTEVFSAFANEHRDDFLFGSVTDFAGIPQAEALTAPSVVLWKQFDEGRNDFSGALSAQDLLEFVHKHSVPLLDEISPANFAMYAESGLPLAYIFVEATDPKREALLDELKPIAKAQQGSVNFVWIDALKFADHAKSLNLADPTWPAFAIQNVQEQTKYPFDQKKSVDLNNIDSFVKDFIDGKVEPSVKSQAIPATQDDSVYVLVADAFDQVVYGEKNDKDVFVEFYAPWCGHCKRLKPIWDQLGDRFNDSKDKVVIAKFDATENDLPSSAGFRVSGFPTIKFKPSGSRNFIDYEGDRSLESLIEFVEEHSANKVKANNDVPVEAVPTDDEDSHTRDEL